MSNGFATPYKRLQEIVDHDDYFISSKIKKTITPSPLSLSPWLTQAKFLHLLIGRLKQILYPYYLTH
jgi:hypothetical protein